MNTQPQLTTTAEALASRLSHGSGTSAKLPVTSSSPSNTMLISPTGKISAPTNGVLVWTAPVKARLVATPRMAPDSMPRINRSRGAKASLRLPVSTIATATSAGFT